MNSKNKPTPIKTAKWIIEQSPEFWVSEITTLAKAYLDLHEKLEKANDTIHGEFCGTDGCHPLHTEIKDVSPSAVMASLKKEPGDGK